MPSRGYNRRGSNRPWRLVLIGGLGILAAIAGVVIYLSQSSSQDVSSTVKNPTSTAPKSTGGTEGGPDQVVPGPANRYTPLMSELKGSFSVDAENTFIQNISTFASSYLFKDANSGADYARQWKIVDGYKEMFDPDGLNAGVLQGRYYVTAETYLFQDVDGAKAAFAYMDNFFTTFRGSIKQQTRGLGNQSGAYEILSGTVGTSEIKQVYDRFLFRRGNIVATVMTAGGQPFMTIDQARDIAVIIDDRILGNRAATTPTPLPTPAFIAPTVGP